MRQLATSPLRSLSKTRSFHYRFGHIFAIGANLYGVFAGWRCGECFREIMRIFFRKIRSCECAIREKFVISRMSRAEDVRLQFATFVWFMCEFALAQIFPHFIGKQSVAKFQYLIVGRHEFDCICAIDTFSIEIRMSWNCVFIGKSRYVSPIFCTL